MGVLLSFLLGIISKIIVDKKFKSTAKISFAVLNFAIFVFMIFSSNDVIVVNIVSNIINKESYDILHEALNYKSSINIITYSSYNLLCLVVLGELLITVFKFSEITSKHFYNELNKIINLIKEKRIRLEDNKDSYLNNWTKLYIINVRKRYFLRCLICK